MLWLSLPLHGAECLMPGVPEKQSGAEKAAVSWMTCGAGPWEALPRCPPQDGAETPVRWPHCLPLLCPGLPGLHSCCILQGAEKGG